MLMHSTKRYNGSGDLKNGAPSQFLFETFGLDGLYKKNKLKLLGAQCSPRHARRFVGRF